MPNALSSGQGGATYYNEHDPYAAAWLRNLIAAGLISPGEVDTRSIVDVRPADLVGFTRCHFFAGIGVWDYALRLAGWPADRPVWTGSCPCQPFSAAGRQRGIADERHLWPVWVDLIRQCKPAIILGEQVEAAVRLGWLDAVFSDLEGEDYACGAVVLGAHSVGAPHIRQRLWFVADAAGAGRRHAEDAGADRGYPGALQGGGQRQSGLREPQRGGAAGAVAHAKCSTNEHLARGIFGPQGASFGWGNHGSGGRGATGVMGNAERIGVRGSGCGPNAGASGGVSDPHGKRQRLRDEPRAAGATRGMGDAAGQRQREARGATDGPRAAEMPAGSSAIHPWSDLEWLPCRDGKARPTQPGLQPLAHGAASRVGRLRAYGNAIVPQAAAAFISAVLDVTPTTPLMPARADGERP